jgi:hypothetical protein
VQLRRAWGAAAIVAVTLLAAPAAPAAPAAAAVAPSRDAVVPAGEVSAVRDVVPSVRSSWSKAWKGLDLGSFLRCDGDVEVTGSMDLKVHDVSSSFQRWKAGDKGEWFRASIRWQTTISAKVTADATTRCVASRRLKKLEAHVVIAGVRIGVHPEVELDLEAAGEIRARQTAVNALKVTGRVGIGTPKVVKRGHVDPPVVAAAGSIVFDAYVGAGIDVRAGVVELDVTLLGGLHVKAEAKTSPAGVCVSGYPIARATATFGVRFFEWHKGVTFFDRTWRFRGNAFGGCTYSAPVVTSTAPPSGEVGVDYQFQLTTQDQREGVWTLAGGTLPPGLTIEDDSLEGTPTTPGSYHPRIRFTDEGGLSTKVELPILVVQLPVGQPWATTTPGVPYTLTSWRNGDLGVASCAVDVFAPDGTEIFGEMAPDNPSHCAQGIDRDSTGAYYVNGGYVVTKYDPAGTMVWQRPVPDGALGPTVSEPIHVGSNGTVYALTSHTASGGDVQITGWDVETGAMTFQKVGPYQDFDTYSGGLVAIDGGIVDYFDYAGTLVKHVPVSPSLSAGVGGGAVISTGGVVYAAGRPTWHAQGDCDMQLHLIKITPAGQVWDKAFAEPDCGGDVELAAIPGGGVAVGASVAETDGSAPSYQVRTVSPDGVSGDLLAPSAPDGNPMWWTTHPQLVAGTGGDVVLVNRVDYRCEDSLNDWCSEVVADALDLTAGVQTQQVVFDADSAVELISAAIAHGDIVVALSERQGGSPSDTQTFHIRAEPIGHVGEDYRTIVNG